MTVEELRAISLSLPGVTEDIKWQNHLCFSVGHKMFLVTSPDVIPSTAAFKVHQDVFAEIISKVGFSKHSHLGRHFWIHLDDINRLTKKEWDQYIKQSYQLIVAKLSTKIKKQLGYV